MEGVAVIKLAGILAISMWAASGMGASEAWLPRFQAAQPPAPDTQQAPPEEEKPQQSSPEGKPQGQPAPEPDTSKPSAETKSTPQNEPPPAAPAQTAKPNQEQAPPQEQTKPEQTPATTPAPAEQPNAAPAQTTEKAPACPSNAKTKRRKCKPASARKVVRQGGTSDVAVDLSPAVSQEQASHQRQNASQLIASTDENLKKIASRQLKPSQQETLNQIQNYMQQARTALAAGELERSRNLAFKAHLLSDELLRH